MSMPSRVVVSASVILAVAVLGGCDIGRANGTPPSSKQAAAQRLPRLVDLGAGKCIPCKAMAPVLEELEAEYAGRMHVQFIDVWKDPDAAKPYGIHIIPTQIFYGADGRELARHQGFMGKHEILAQWRALGVSF
jgi:thioredoxin 1